MLTREGSTICSRCLQAAHRGCCLCGLTRHPNSLKCALCACVLHQEWEPEAQPWGTTGKRVCGDCAYRVGLPEKRKKIKASEYLRDISRLTWPAGVLRTKKSP